MNKLFRSHWILSAAVLAVPLFGLTSQADAQNRINQNGQMLDANNRIGSGGTNPNDSGLRAPQVNGNDVVTGNVSGGKQFRGNVPYTNSRNFRGSLPSGQIDDFIRSSSSADWNDPGSANRVDTFYGTRTVTPPAGYQQNILGSSSFVAPPSIIHQRTNDQRLGDIYLMQPNLALPAPGQLLLPGPVDPSAGQQYIMASPLTGVRQIGANDSTITNTQYNPTTGRLGSVQIEKMQDEMNMAAGGAGPISTAVDTGTPPNTGATPVVQKSVTVADPAATPVNQKPVNSAITQTPNSMATDQGTRQRLLVPPQAQSTLYAELLKRHEKAAGDPNISDSDANRAFNAAVRAKEQDKDSAFVPGAQGVPAVTPGSIATPGVTVVPGTATPVPGSPQNPPDAPADPNAAASGSLPPGVIDYVKKSEDLLKGTHPGEKTQMIRSEPVKVPSLATGMKGKGLIALLQGAEGLMKEGKFTSALDQYDQAEQVAPNNPLIRLGRANAELGAAYYARADAHLRDAFSRNHELLVGQYDLNSWLGEQRMQVLVNDLKELANKDQKDPRPIFLLAYIAYNTGHEQNAEAYIDLADKRSGGKDPFYKLLRDNWALPEKPVVDAPVEKPAKENK